MASLAGDGYAESKIVDVLEAAQTARRLKNQKKKVVFTNGCFDLIHYGHIQYLQKAKKLGDWLVLGLNSDASVKKLKGAGRPVLNENDRAHIMAALDCVDQVVLFGEPTPLKLIKSIKPDILVKGGDYTVNRIVGHKEVKKWGGRAVTIPYQEGKSTSGVIKQIVESRRR
jgi:D-beta-D-heptose 7-phosphate kinase/D-beta-D-heptose 1-phosphate adenosyltransferase